MYNHKINPRCRYMYIYLSQYLNLWNTILKYKLDIFSLPNLFIIPVLVDGPYCRHMGLHEMFQAVFCVTCPGTNKAGLPNPRVPNDNTLDIFVQTTSLMLNHLLFSIHVLAI